MPQQPNMQQLLKQAQKMQQDMLAAQESLKDEVVEASAGGGMVTVEVTGELVVKSIKIRTTSSCSRTWSSQPSTRDWARPRSSRRRSSAASPADSGAWGSQASRSGPPPCTHRPYSG